MYSKQSYKMMVATARTYAASLGEEAFELIVALWIVILVKRCYGYPGPGGYEYSSAFFTDRCFANWGA